MRSNSTTTTPAQSCTPATVVVPAVVAVAESIGASGADTLLATILGMEVMVRLGLACDAVETMLNGFHLTGICGAAGTAAGVAKLLGLGEDEIAHALGLGATQAAGLMGFLHDGSESKRLHAGRAAQNGIVAAELAKRGMTGPPRAFELEHGGFLHAFLAGPETGAAGTRSGHALDDRRASFKRYPVCGAIHSTVDSVRQALAERDGRAIRSVRVGHSPAIVRQNGWPYEPSDQLHAQMSLRYSVAALIAEGELLPRQFRPELIADPRVMEIVQRVDVVADDRVAALYPHKSASCVTVEFDDGTAREYFAETPKGSPENPLSFAELEEKFRRLAEPLLGEERCAQVVAATRGFEGLDSVEPFVAPLRERAPALAAG